MELFIYAVLIMVALVAAIRILIAAIIWVSDVLQYLGGQRQTRSGYWVSKKTMAALKANGLE